MGIFPILGGTWPEKAIFQKLNPPSVLSSFLVWDRCQESPHKFSKSGHWGILRNLHFSIFQNNAFLRILYIYVFSKRHQNWGTENTVILPPAELFSFLRYWHLKLTQFFSHLRGWGAPLLLMYRKCAEILGQLQMSISRKQKELTRGAPLVAK